MGSGNPLVKMGRQVTPMKMNRLFQTPKVGHLVLEEEIL